MRLLLGVLLLVALGLTGFGLLHTGVYGLTIFVLFPVFLGAIVAFIFRPQTPSQAAMWGALMVLTALFSLLLVKVEGLVCILMALPLALPLGAVGGLLFHWTGRSRVTKPGVAMLLLLPSASITWDATARPPVFEVRARWKSQLLRNRSGNTW